MELLFLRLHGKPYLTEESEFVIWKKSIGLIQKKVSSNKFFESPVLALYKSIRSLALCKKDTVLQTPAEPLAWSNSRRQTTDPSRQNEFLHTHCFCLFSFGVQDGEFELGSNFAFWTAHQQQIEGEVIFTFFIQAFRVHT